MLKTILISTTVLTTLAYTSGQVVAEGKRLDFGYLILGTIASVNKSKSVALIKHRSSGKTKAVKIGDVVGKDLILTAIDKKKVTVKYQGKEFHVRVGSSEEFGRADASNIASREGGLQKDGSRVTVSSTYKDHLLKNNLNDILMQAAAVPSFQNGRLNGFTLWEISPGSIYEKLGFKNGDTVTSINDMKLVDAGQAVKVLVSLKNAKNVALNYLRGGVERQMEIKVQ